MRPSRSPEAARDRCDARADKVVASSADQEERRWSQPGHIQGKRLLRSAEFSVYATPARWNGFGSLAGDFPVPSRFREKEKATTAQRPSGRRRRTRGAPALNGICLVEHQVVRMPHGLKGVLVGLGNPLLDISAGEISPRAAVSSIAARASCRRFATGRTLYEGIGADSCRARRLWAAPPFHGRLRHRISGMKSIRQSVVLFTLAAHGAWTVRLRGTADLFRTFRSGAQGDHREVRPQAQQCHPCRGQAPAGLPGAPRSTKRFPPCTAWWRRPRVCFSYSSDYLKRIGRTLHVVSIAWTRRQRENWQRHAAPPPRTQFHSRRTQRRSS